MKKGKLIVIEGVDGSGKSVQAKMLIERLRSLKYKVLEGDFPRYETSEWGKLVGRFLNGEFGGMKEVSPYLVALPYMLDEYTWSRDVGKPWLDKGGWVVSNRYFTSNVHQVAKQVGKNQVKYRDWLWDVGYNHLGILEPDVVIFLDVPIKVSSKLVFGKAKRDYLKKNKKDIAEKDAHHQKQAYLEYTRMVKTNRNWKSVKCVEGKSLLSPEKIHERVWAVVKKAVLE